MQESNTHQLHANGELQTMALKNTVTYYLIINSYNRINTSVSNDMHDVYIPIYICMLDTQYAYKYFPSFKYQTYLLCHILYMHPHSLASISKVLFSY